MRNSGPVEFDLLEAFVGNARSFLNTLGDLVRFTKSNTNSTLFIPRNYKSREAETTSTFHHFGTAIDENDFLGEFVAFGVSRSGLTLTSTETTAVTTTLAGTATAVTTTAAIITATVV